MLGDDVALYFHRSGDYPGGNQQTCLMNSDEERTNGVNERFFLDTKI